MNPFKSVENPSNKPDDPPSNEHVDQTSCENSKCPTGERCDASTKMCYKLTQISLQNDKIRSILSVDGKRGKKYDYEFLTDKLGRIRELQSGDIPGQKRGKKYTINELKKLISTLKLNLSSNSKNTYYGTLRDELIIQIIYLENSIQNKADDDTTVNGDILIDDIDSPSKIISSVTSELKSISPEKVDIDIDNSFEPDLYTVPDLNVDDDDQEKQIVPPMVGDNKKYNEFLRNKERVEKDTIKITDDYDFLYPELDDPNFNIKLAKRKEFNDTKYNGEIYDIKKQAEKMCNADFELTPHQLFVKNFLSFQTPYNALLLYHGLGTGKTCSAIGVAEEMRNYMKQVGISQRIMVIASPNVQNNFRLQLFDDRKLQKEGGIWNLESCIGNALLHEVNPIKLENLPKEKIIQQINSIINQYYLFMGYGELANYIKRKISVDSSNQLSVKQQKQMEIDKIKELFNNRLVIIDEVHNIRVMQNNKESKKIGNLLMRVCEHADNIRLLLLSATPIYNNHKEIIWLTNLLNIVDKRSLIDESDIFNKTGEFVESRTLPDGKVVEGGEELLKRKLIGYVSYVRGENPYTFPYRIYPNDFSPDNALNIENYPSTQMNNKKIDTIPSKLPIYVNDIGDYQKNVYNFIIKNLLEKTFSTSNIYGQTRDMPNFENMESFGYTHLGEPLQCLNIAYPNHEFDTKYSEETQADEKDNEEDTPENEKDEEEDTKEDEKDVEEVSGEDDSDDTNENEDILGNDIGIRDNDTLNNTKLINNMVGKHGLSNVVTFEETTSPHELRHNFKYKPEILDKYGKIFHQDNIKKYSAKIHNICNIIKKSTGIVMIYSQYIDGGVVPMALALEEMGFTRYGFASHTKSLFATPPTEQIDAITYDTLSNMTDQRQFSPAKYVMITGDKSFSPNNLADLKYITSPDNKNGEHVKVILITRAAAEGLDFKNIRQLHVLEPWYNMNRTEQIIGRAVRNLSHCNLPFEKRNVEIYLHTSQNDDEKETADLYIYRYAENKAIQIGKITRILKELAVDCILNIGQTEFTVENMNKLVENQNINLTLSSDKTIEYKIGDKNGSSLCDYMNCDFVCSPTTPINDEDINKNTYTEHYIKMNYSSIAKRIRDLFKEKPFYKRDQLIKSIEISREYPGEQIDYVLSMFVENKYNYITDKYGRKGYLINTGEFYGYQPVEISDEQSSVYDRTVPVDYKPNEMYMELPTEKINTDKPSKTVLDESKQSSPGIEVNNKKYDTLLNQLLSKLATVREEHERSTKFLLETAENDWYKHVGYVYNELIDRLKIPQLSVEKYIIYHWLDTLTIEDKLILLFKLYNTNRDDSLDSIDAKDETDIIKGEKTRAPIIMKAYFDNKIINHNETDALALGHNNHIDLYIQDKVSRHWKKATLSIVREFKDKLRERYFIDTKTIQPFVGFMHLFKKNEMVFKMKEITGSVTNNKGVKCSLMGKNEIIKFFNNKVLVNNPYPVEYEIRQKYDVNGKDAKDILRHGYCVLMEMIMRYFNDCPLIKDKHVWFFDVEKTLANDLIKL